MTKVIASRSFEVILPGGKRMTINTKSGSLGGRKAGAWATAIAKQAGLPLGRSRWRLRGPLGVVHPQMLIRNIDLKVGEALKLELKQ